MKKNALSTIFLVGFSLVGAFGGALGGVSVSALIGINPNTAALWGGIVGAIAMTAVAVLSINRWK